MRSRIEPMKKIARSLRQHRELILNYFRAQKLISSGVVEGLNNKAKVTMRKSYGFAPTGYWNWPSITHLASCPSRNQPTISSDESESLSDVGTVSGFAIAAPIALTQPRLFDVGITRNIQAPDVVLGEFNSQSPKVFSYLAGLTAGNNRKYPRVTLQHPCDDDLVRGTSNFIRHLPQCLQARIGVRTGVLRRHRPILARVGSL
jgi:hypothetical protein